MVNARRTKRAHTLRHRVAKATGFFRVCLGLGCLLLKRFIINFVWKADSDHFLFFDKSQGTAPFFMIFNPKSKSSVEAQAQKVRLAECW